MTNDDATIVTFYSYKGGVGRSMAVANVAWVLAEKFHKRVLVVDWDLEAPGLHRFFDIQDQEVNRGLIELLNDYKALLRDEQKSLPEKLVDVRRYILSAKSFSGGGEISILAAGKQDKNYATQINQFSWEEFYAKWHGFGFIEYLKSELKKLPDLDIVILDSRTGVTDIGGICTLQLPDIVVLLFALNDQNINGVRLVAERISQKAVEIEGRDQPPVLIIRPARVERTGNQNEKVKWQQVAAEVLGEFVTEGDPQVLMAKRNIPYIGDYSYGETPLAVKKDPLGDMAEAFEDLAESILQTGGRVDSSRRSRSFLTPISYLSRSVERFVRNKTNVAILALMGLPLAGLLVTAELRRTEITNLTAELNQIKASQYSALSAPPATTPAASPVASDPETTPADWYTTKPARAWCYQSDLKKPGPNNYLILCQWSQSQCESIQSRQTLAPVKSKCQLVQDLNATGWNPNPRGFKDSWFQYSDQPFRPPFPQLP
jgi:cellulose biosynthesis protein BcsQ